MAIVFCTTCKGRAEHLKVTLPANIKHNRKAKFVVLDYASPDGLLNWLRSHHAADIASGKLTVYSFPTAGPFHMAHAKNMGHRLGMAEGAEILVTQDADNFTGEGFDEHIEAQFRDKDVFLSPTIPNSGVIRLAPRGIAGRLVVRAQDFVKAGGYDEKYDTWRGEDIDLHARLRRMGYIARNIELRHLNAIRHGADVRFKEYPHAQQYEDEREVRLVNLSRKTVVNAGDFGCGIVYRNFGTMPIMLGKIPTRIFGIGLHKTATSSLNRAFKMLGYDSFHWESGDQARDIWDEMNDLGYSWTLERSYALCDLPIPLLYKKLDEAYPKSKFILTVRDEDKWLKSVERMWNPKFNPSRWEWDVYPFSNRIHRALYGQSTFDPVVFRTRYRQHNAEVCEYFKNRPHDLLIMNMDAGAGWPELCRFLGHSIPQTSYPREYVTAELVAT